MLQHGNRITTTHAPVDFFEENYIECAHAKGFREGYIAGAALEHKEHNRCPFCGGNIVWGSDENADDCYAEYEGDEEAIVSFYTCDKCGRQFEVSMPVKEERETTYKAYWKG